MTSAHPDSEPPRDREQTAHPARMTADWIGRHQARVWRYLLFLGAPPALAEDLAQDTFLAALEKGVPDRADGEWAGWLATTARNLYFAHGRKAGRAVPEVDFDAVDPAVAERAWRWFAGDGDGAEALAGLEQCLTTLDARERRALELRYRDGASRDAMAASLGVSAAGVKQLLRRVRERLRLCMQRRRERS